MLALFSLPQASTLAANVDGLFNFITLIDVISFVGVIGAILYFIHKYRRSKSDPEQTPYIEGHPVAEGTLMVVLFILVMVMFAWGWIDYVKLRTVPADAMEVNVTGRQWMWNFEYLNGRRFVNEVTVPKGKPVIIRSRRRGRTRISRKKKVPSTDAHTKKFGRGKRNQRQAQVAGRGSTKPNVINLYVFKLLCSNDLVRGVG